MASGFPTHSGSPPDPSILREVAPLNVHTDPKGKLFTDLVTKQEIKALIQTVTHLIQGNLHVYPGIRPLDELNRSGEFIAITQATVLGPDGKELYRADFLAQGKSHIVWVLPI